MYCSKLNPKTFISIHVSQLVVMAIPDPPVPLDGAITFNPYMVAPSPFYTHVAQPSGPSNIITTAGQIGRKLDGSIPQDAVEQIEEAFANLGRCLEAAGAQVGFAVHEILSDTNTHALLR